MLKNSIIYPPHDHNAVLVTGKDMQLNVVPTTESAASSLNQPSKVSNDRPNVIRFSY